MHFYCTFKKTTKRRITLFGKTYTLNLKSKKSIMSLRKIINRTQPPDCLNWKLRLYTGSIALLCCDATLSPGWIVSAFRVCTSGVPVCHNTKLQADGDEFPPRFDLLLRVPAICGFTIFPIYILMWEKITKYYV